MTVFKIPSHVEYTNVAGDVVILDHRRGTYLGLDEVGSVIWSLLLENLTPAEIVERLTAEYQVSRDKVEQDVPTFVNDLLARGVIEQTSSESAVT